MQPLPQFRIAVVLPDQFNPGALVRIGRSRQDGIENSPDVVSGLDGSGGVAHASTPLANWVAFKRVW